MAFLVTYAACWPNGERPSFILHKTSDTRLLTIFFTTVLLTLASSLQVKFPSLTCLSKYCISQIHKIFLSLALSHKLTDMRLYSEP